VGDVVISTVPLILKGLTVAGFPSGHALDSEEAIAFAQRQDIKCLIEKFPLDKAQEALDHMLSGKCRFRAVLVMD
jgi:D-arabinose 1-dehydrogenase-like Zn-dependent alcohol dehydrogenase